jgi:Domain of unknown function (DUF397)
MRPTGPLGARWRKSSRCAHGDCIEVASHASRVAVRDSQDNASGPNLVFAPAQWRSFIKGVKNGNRADG